MKSVEIPCVGYEKDRAEIAGVTTFGGGRLLRLKIGEKPHASRSVLIDREGVKKLIAAAQEWLQNSPE